MRSPVNRHRLWQVAVDAALITKEEVIAEGPRIRILVNGKQTIDFTDPNKTYTKGHFALQGHDPGSEVHYKNIKVKPLP